MSRSPDSPRSPGIYAKGVARRQEILDRAILVLAREGAQRTSLRAIGQEVSVTHAALKHYFGSLDELLVAVHKQRESGFAPDYENGEASPIQVMIDGAKVNEEEVPGIIQLYTTLVSEALEKDRLVAREYITQRFARIRREIAERIRHDQDGGLIRDDLDAEAAASLIIAASDGLQTQWLLDREVPHILALETLGKLLKPR